MEDPVPLKAHSQPPQFRSRRSPLLTGGLCALKQMHVRINRSPYFTLAYVGKPDCRVHSVPVSVIWGTHVAQHVLQSACDWLMVCLTRGIRDASAVPLGL